MTRYRWAAAPLAAVFTMGLAAQQRGPVTEYEDLRRAAEKARQGALAQMDGAKQLEGLKKLEDLKDLQELKQFEVFKDFEYKGLKELEGLEGLKGWKGLEGLQALEGWKDGVLGGIVGGVAGGIAGGVPGGVGFGAGKGFGFDGKIDKWGLSFAQPSRREREDDSLYERGQQALDRRRYDDALGAFGEVAARGGPRADGALYWKAYTENKLGKRAEALATIETLRKSHPNSRWQNDAKALEVEVKQAQGQKVTPESETDEELKLIAINSLAHSDPDRAVPLLEKLVASSQSAKLRERALFVLMQTGSPKARQVVVQAAKGGSNPDLQLKAIRYLGEMGGRKELGEVYAAATDSTVKRAVLRGFQSSGARDELFNAAKTEKDPDVRREAIRQLGNMGMHNELFSMYQSESDTKIKAEMVRAMANHGNTEKLLEVARTEKVDELRREAIRSLGNMGARRTSDALASLYSSETQAENRKEIIRALSNQGAAKPLVDIARKEADPNLKKHIVENLSRMRSKEATDYLMELLK